MSRSHAYLVLLICLAFAGLAPAKAIRSVVDDRESYALTFSPDGKYLAMAGLDGMVHLRETATGKEVAAFKQGQKQGQITTWSVAFSADSKRLAAPCNDQIIRVWDVATGQELHKLQGHGMVVWCVAASPTGNLLASGGEGGTIRLWDLAQGKAVRQLAGPLGVWPMTFSPDGKTLAAGYSTGVIRLWDVATGKALRQFAAHQAGIWPLVFSPDGRTLASCRWQGNTVRLWDVATGKERRQIQVAGGTGWNLAFSPDGRTLLTGGGDNTVTLWETATGKERLRLTGHKSAVYAVAFSPDGRTVASGDATRTITFWDTAGTPAKPAAKDLKPLWDTLQGADGIKTHEAIWVLRQAPEVAVSFLREKLRPRQVVLPDPRRVARLIDDLNHPKYIMRKKATEELEKLGKLAEKALRRALEKPPTLEVRMRLERLLDRLADRDLSPDQIQAVRALEALEYVATPAARKALDALARQDTDTWLQGEAKGVLERLARRK
jgi:WD40 repeat protein